MPESCVGGSTWVIDESTMESVTSVQSSSNVEEDKKSESIMQQSSRDKFFGVRNVLGPRNTITWGVETSVNFLKIITYLKSGLSVDESSLKIEIYLKLNLFKNRKQSLLV